MPSWGCTAASRLRPHRLRSRRPASQVVENTSALGGHHEGLSRWPSAAHPAPAVPLSEADSASPRDKGIHWASRAKSWRPSFRAATRMLFSEESNPHSAGYRSCRTLQRARAILDWKRSGSVFCAAHQAAAESGSKRR